MHLSAPPVTDRHNVLRTNGLSTALDKPTMMDCGAVAGPSVPSCLVALAKYTFTGLYAEMSVVTLM